MWWHQSHMCAVDGTYNMWDVPKGIEVTLHTSQFASPREMYVAIPIYHHGIQNIPQHLAEHGLRHPSSAGHGLLEGSCRKKVQCCHHLVCGCECRWIVTARLQVGRQ